MFRNCIFVSAINKVKKVFSIFLSLIFLASAVGMTINSHYCGMKLRSVSLTEKNCCCKKDKKMPKDCCKNEIVYVKITDNYSPSTEFHFAKIDIAPIVLSFAFPSNICHLTSSILFKNHSPPPIFADRVVAFHSFLI